MDFIGLIWGSGLGRGRIDWGMARQTLTFSPITMYGLASIDDASILAVMAQGIRAFELKHHRSATEAEIVACVDKATPVTRRCVRMVRSPAPLSLPVEGRRFSSRVRVSLQTRPKDF